MTLFLRFVALILPLITGSGESLHISLRPDSLFRSSRPAMGTTVEIFLYAPDGETAAALFETAFSEVERVEAALSSYRPTSEVSRINRRASDGPLTTDPEVFDLLVEAQKLSRMTGGAFDFTVGPLTRAWGFFDAQGRYPSERELDEARSRTGWAKVLMDEESRTVFFLSPDIELDLGGIGKGWALDRVGRRFQGLGVTSALLGFGRSSYLAIGAPPETSGWTVRIPDPSLPGDDLTSVLLRNQALSTSGSSERYFDLDGKKYSHIIDPRTGVPAQELVQVTVVAPTATVGDAISTALFVLGPEGGGELAHRHRDLQALLVSVKEGERRVVGVRWPKPIG